MTEGVREAVMVELREEGKSIGQKLAMGEAACEEDCKRKRPGQVCSLVKKQHVDSHKMLVL